MLAVETGPSVVHSTRRPRWETSCFAYRAGASVVTSARAERVSGTTSRYKCSLGGSRHGRAEQPDPAAPDRPGPHESVLRGAARVGRVPGVRAPRAPRCRVL